MEVASIRINKVLKELNVSLDRAVDLLNDKGYEVEARPTSKITQQMYEILFDEFQTDRSKRIQSSKVAEEKEKEKKEILDEIGKTEEVVKAKAVAVSGPKIVDKIDLEPTKIEKRAIEEKLPKKELKEEKSQEKQESTEIKKAEEEKSDEKQPSKEEGGILKARTKKLLGPVKTGQVVDLKQFEKKPKPVKKEAETKKEPEQKRRKRIRVQNPKSSGGGTNQRRDNNRGRNRSAAPKVELTDEQIQKQVRETLEKLQGKGNKSKGAKYRREKRDIHRQKTDDTLQQQEAESKILKVTEFVTLSEMAVLMDAPVNDLISACMSLGIMVTMNQRLDAETLSIVAEEFGYEVQFTTDDIEESIEEVEDSPEDLEPRAPIVTVMGHVDHGKTSLLDYIRSSNVIAGESGGITQHIDAYAVQLDGGQKITFLDTPGHEAFTAMRARGSQVTDIAIVVVAADDGVMPQTKEAISHAQAAGVPIIFAINKVDKSTANPDKIKEQLSTMNLLVEDWGGKIQSQDISAKTGAGVGELLEKVLLESELLELKANPNRPAQGTVVDALLDKGRGYVSTILVEVGTLKIGDYVLAGKHSGKVKALQDERKHNLEFVGPSTPVSILGLDGAPQGGDKFYVFSDEKEAKQMADKRSQLHREQSVRTQKHITLDEIGRRIALGDFKELNIILKGDVDGSVEALTDSIQKLSTEEIQVNIIHKGVGAITESDVLLASASDAIIIGFNVRPTGNSRIIADREEIDIRTYSIIYDAINDLKDAIEGMLSPEIKEEITGTAEIRQTFKVSKIGTIAGCMVINGKIFSNSQIRIIRDGVVVHSGVLSSLKRFKDDVKEVSKGYDCGIQIKKYDTIQENDVIEAFEEVEVRKKLK